MVDKALIILGPTSSGKTSLAIKVAKQINGEIVSVDSRQVYKQMDIGTGKLPVNSNLKIEKFDGYWKIDGIKIHMYDCCFPDQEYTVTDFVKEAKARVSQIINEGRVPILVGGTGFYLDVLTSEKNIFQTPDNKKLRETLSNLSLEELQKKLEKLDTKRFSEVDIHNPIRLIRAIEINLSNAKEVNIGLNNFEYLKIGLTSDRKYLYSRVEKWIEIIMNNGLIDEVQGLIDKGYKNTSPMKGIIYKNVVDYTEGSFSKSDLLKLMINDLHHYIKRQETYFKKIENVVNFDIRHDSFDQAVLKQVELFYDVKS